MGEACDGNADCEAQCKKVFYESPFEDFTDEEWNGYTEPLKDLQKHEEHSHLLMGGNSFGFTAHRGSTLVVAFKGTDDAGDGMADLNFIPNKFTVESRDGRKESFWGHRGFIQYYEGIREKVIAAVEQTGSSVPQDVHELLVTGHSLGGAMATLCAVDLAVRYPDMKVSLYTYGSPRVFMGNTKEASNMNSAFHVHEILSTAPNSNHRYMVNGDPVPTAPLENMGFMHCGDGLELNDGGRSECEHCHMDHTKMLKDVKNHYGVTYTKLIERPNRHNALQKRSCNRPAHHLSDWFSHEKMRCNRPEHHLSDWFSHEKMSCNPPEHHCLIDLHIFAFAMTRLRGLYILYRFYRSVHFLYEEGVFFLAFFLSLD